MNNQKVSNEQIDQKLNLILDHLKLQEKRMDILERNQERHEEKTDESIERIKNLETSHVQWKSWLLVLAMGATVIINFILTRLMLLSGKFAYQPIMEPLIFS